MGATGSRSSETTLLVTIFDYSKLMLAPVHLNPWDTIRFRELRWDVRVTPMRNEETGVSDFLIVRVSIGVQHSAKSALGIDISIEILDHTGEHTVFHRESSREEADGYLLLGVRRSELEASSCIKDDILLVRCTLKEQPRPSFLGDWFSSKFKKELPVSESEVAITRSHTLTVDSLSQLKAALLSCECAYSTHFAVGGNRWYLKLSPTLGVVRLVRATKEDDETVTRAEFSFALEGALNVQSGNMTHLFDRANPDCEFAYQQPEVPSTSTDRLVVRCYVEVIPDAVVPADVPPPSESVRTPLLSAMHS